MLKRFLILPFLALLLVLHSCTDGQAQNSKLSAQDFANKIKELPNAPIIDVRTPDEFDAGHISNAQNIDWNGNNFEQKSGKLEKGKAVFVYCLSGGRSAAAVAKLKENGFKQIYELEGGMMKWRAAQLPETKDKSVHQSTQITKEQYNAMLQTDKVVLIDFYADWCKPCKMMKPFLEEISTEMKDKVVVIRINADDNPEICKELSVEALPTIFVYKGQKMTWYNVGYIDKSEIKKHL